MNRDESHLGVSWLQDYLSGCAAGLQRSVRGSRLGERETLYGRGETTRGGLGEST
jgi:hypothetical protein